jgi:hypothetical protein
MNIKAFTRREKMLELREKLLVVEKERMNGARYYTADELDKELSEIIVAAGSKKQVLS